MVTSRAASYRATLKVRLSILGVIRWPGAGDLVSACFLWCFKVTTVLIS